MWYLLAERRTGTSIVELIVSLAVIVVAAGLLVPAVMSARENARATACKNNLRQITLALENVSVD